MNIFNTIIKSLKTIISKVFQNNNYTQKIVYSTHKCSIKQKTFKTLTDWIKSFNNTHFLTLRLPENLQTANFEVSKKHLKDIMAKFERNLLGRHWSRKHLPFICFAEKGQSDCWHYHILFNAGDLTTEQLETALNETSKHFKLALYSFNLQQIKETEDYTNFYCVKEIKIKENGKFNSDRIILSAELFGLPLKIH